MAIHEFKEALVHALSQEDSSEDEIKQIIITAAGFLLEKDLVEVTEQESIPPSKGKIRAMLESTHYDNAGLILTVSLVENAEEYVKNVVKEGNFKHKGPPDLKVVK